MEYIFIKFHKSLKKKNIVTRLCQLEELSVFIEKCLEKNDFQENHLALFLADFNVDAKG